MWMLYRLGENKNSNQTYHLPGGTSDQKGLKMIFMYQKNTAIRWFRMTHVSFLTVKYKITITVIACCMILSITSCGRSNWNNPETIENKQMSPSFSSKQSAISSEIFRLLYENPNKARSKALSILDSLPSGHDNLKIELLKHVGSSYVLETNYIEALAYYKEALQKAELNHNLIEKARINNNIGVIHNEVGNLKSAYLHFSEALNYYDLLGYHQEKAGTKNNIGLIYQHLNNHQKAFEYLTEALQGSIEAKDSILTVSVLNNMALNHITNGDFDLAHEKLIKAIEISQKTYNTYGLCISYHLKGKSYQTMGQHPKALKAYTKSKTIALTNNMSYQLAVSKLGIARSLLGMDQTTEALNTAYEVMQLALEQNSLVFKSEAHEVLSEIYEKKQFYNYSLKHFKDRQITQEEIVNQTVVHQIYDIELNYLSQQNKLQQLELEKKELAISKHNNILYSTFISFSLLLLGLYLIYRNYRHRQKVKLQKTIIELTEKKSHAALEAEIQERKRIGQELHDGLGHLLSLSGLHASLLYKRKDFTPEKRDQMLESLMKTIDDAFAEVRHISHNLAPTLLSERGLCGALKNISDKINQSARLHMSYKTFGLTHKLNTLVENTLFRTIQEIVNNTIKHSTATQLFIQITQGNQEITLMAEDNGKGFDLDKIKNHSGNGLSNMKSRIENLKGTLFIDTNPNRGTIISILIPL